MKAIIQEQYGGTETLRYGETDLPVLHEDEVLIRVHAAGVDAGVWHLMTGLPYLVRLMGYGLRRPRSRVPGMDVAGRVEAVGAEVIALQPGDEVFGTCTGAFAEYAVTREDRLVPMPANLTFVQAAAVPTAGCAALHGLRDKGELRPGQRVLVIGAGGGVGSFAVQLGRALGAEVTGVCSTAKAGLVAGLGAAEVIDYTREDLTDRGLGRYDLILDTAGNRPLSLLRRLLTPEGTLVIVGAEGGGKWFGHIDRQLRAGLLSPFVSQRLLPLISEEGQADLRYLVGLLADGRLRPVVGRAYPLAQAAQAVQDWAAGRAHGRLVLTV